MNQLPHYRKKTEEKTLADIHNNNGVDFCVQGQFDEGIAEFNKSLKENPNYPIAYFNRSLAFANLRLQKACMTDFEIVRVLMRDFDELIADSNFDAELIEFIESISGISKR